MLISECVECHICLNVILTPHLPQVSCARSVDIVNTNNGCSIIDLSNICLAMVYFPLTFVLAEFFHIIINVMATVFMFVSKKLE